VFDSEDMAIDYDGDSIWINGDAGFHSGPAGENVIYQFDMVMRPKNWRAPHDSYTWECWINPVSTAGTRTLWGNYAAIKNGAFYQEVQVRNAALRAYETDVSFFASGVLPPGSWAHVVVTVSDALNQIEIYVNGASSGPGANPARLFRPDGACSVGGRTDASILIPATYEHVRLARAGRSSSWVTARYNNTLDPSLFSTAGTPQSPGTPPSGTGGIYIGQAEYVSIYVGDGEHTKIYIGDSLYWEKG